MAFSGKPELCLFHDRHFEFKKIRWEQVTAGPQMALGVKACHGSGLKRVDGTITQPQLLHWWRKPS
jgi:hypothetical protein